MNLRSRREWGTLSLEPDTYGRSHLGLPLEVWLADDLPKAVESPADDRVTWFAPADVIEKTADGSIRRFTQGGVRFVPMTGVAEQ